MICALTSVQAGRRGCICCGDRIQRSADPSRVRRERVYINKGNLAGPLESCSDDVADLRDASISTINDLQRDFFLETALVEGGSLTLDENLRDPAPRRPFLTSDAAAAMPTSARDMISHFGLARGSAMAKDVATAAYLCGNPALLGETF